MPRVVKRPLRGSVRQNLASRASEGEGEGWRLGFGGRLALLILGAVAVLLLLSLSWHNRWPHRALAVVQASALRVSQKVGFAVAEVSVEGRHFTDRAALLSSLGVTSGSPVFAFDPRAAHGKVMALPWIESASVVRSLPDTILVRLIERQPMARWQHDGKTVVIDREGRVLEAAKPEAFANLPLVVGEAAPEQTRALLSLLHDFPVVFRALKAAVRVGGRRWNFFLHPDILVRLPAQEVETALDKLTQLVQEQKILERAVAVVDLRFSTRMVIEPSAQSSAPRYDEAQE